MPQSERLLVLSGYGQSEWNLNTLLAGWTDPDLTPSGSKKPKRRGVG